MDGQTDGQTDGPTDRPSEVWSRIALDYKENDEMTMLLIIIELGMKRFKKFELMQRELQLRPISVAIPTELKRRSISTTVLTL